jgi:hypothetical protein
LIRELHSNCTACLGQLALVVEERAWPNPAGSLEDMHARVALGQLQRLCPLFERDGARPNLNPGLARETDVTPASFGLECPRLDLEAVLPFAPGVRRPPELFAGGFAVNAFVE